MSDQCHDLNDGRNTCERMLGGDLYIAADPQLAPEGRRAAMLLHRFTTAVSPDAQTRRAEDRRTGEL